MQELQVFHFDKDKKSFEDYGMPNGWRYWYASDLMAMLGYETMTTFNKAINKAIGVCAALNITIGENFTEEMREVQGKQEHDWRLSRFACYLVAMNGDSRKPQIATAQGYFASLAEAVQNHIHEAEHVERVVIREEISDHEKTLSGTAFKAGVVRYDLFQNAGYRGLYNMNLWQLKGRKGIDQGRSLLDFMNKEELAANLFRITQTNARIRNEHIRGQRPLEDTAEHVGKAVRKTMIDLSGTHPENLQIAQDIRSVKSGLKSTQKKFGKMDNKKLKILPSPAI